MRRSADGSSYRAGLETRAMVRIKPNIGSPQDIGLVARKQKNPRGFNPAGEGGMVEEIYIHYYRHLVQQKSYTFLKYFFKKL
jgi:hypothetical protein